MRRSHLVFSDAPVVTRQSSNRLTRLTVLAAGAVLAAQTVSAEGIYRNAVGARSMGLAGADTALADDPLSIMHANPGGLGFVANVTLSASAVGASVDGTFSNRANQNGTLNSTPGVFADGALTAEIPGCPLRFGLSVIPEGVLSGDWRYQDTPGGATGHTTYGNTIEKSQIILLRSAFGVGYAFNPHISFGASLGFLYNENVLEAPYIFQRTANLAGVKTLLDLHTSGLGFDGQAGFVIRPDDRWQIGLSYHSKSVIESTGAASGTAGAEFTALGVSANPLFNYQAKVLNVFPQKASGGVQWLALPQLKILAQLDWVNWSDSFHNLRIHLAQGDNSTINSIAGSSALEDSVPLDWRDQFIGRGGLEWMATESWAFRAGYSYAQRAVPDQTLTPLTAAIFQQSISAGVGWNHGTWRFDLGYEYDLPVTANVETSSLLSGEYSQSKVTVSAHWLALTVTKTF